jgi:formylglycine-generating enzyme required for sulfatase activity
MNVSWNDAKQYAAWLSRITGKEYRLLTEAEWEYAARAGTTTTYSWGDDIGKGNADCADCDNQTQAAPAPVGSFKPNAFGLYEMYGNVWEWVEDPWHNSYEGSPTDGSPWLEDGNASRRVVRGGSWISNSQLSPKGRRSAPQKLAQAPLRASTGMAPSAFLFFARWRLWRGCCAASRWNWWRGRRMSRLPG